MGTTAFLLHAFLVFFVAGYETNWQAQTALRKDVFDGYDKIARPIKNSSDVIHVTFGVSIAQLVEVNERKQEIKARFKISQEMTDMRLQWDAEEYDNVTDMIVPYSKFWMPEIILQNSADTYVLPVARHSRLFSNGTVISSAPASLTAPCIIYIQYFPFDIQQCEYRFTTWETNAEEVAMYPLTSTILKVDFLENTEWNIVNTSVTSKLVFYPCCEAPYSTITCLLTIQRRPLYYLITVAMPCHILSILTALTFMLPPCSGEKLTVGISILLNLAVLNLVIANIMPATSIDIPLIVKYIIFSMVFVSTSIVASIFVLSVYHNKSEHRPGRRMRKIFLDILPRLFFLKPFHDDPSLNVFDDKYTLRITDSNMDISKKDFNFENGDYDFERQGLSEYAVKVTESESSREVKRIRGRRSDKPLKYIVRSARQKHEAAAANGSESTSTVRCEHCSLTAEEALLLEILGKENCILDNVGRLAKKERDVIIERQIRDEWKFVAVVIDRILLFVYIIACTVGICILYITKPVIS